MARISPLEPPFSPAVQDHFDRLLPPGVPNLLLFRTLARNLPLAAAMGPWGFYELGPTLSLPLRDREIVIVRTCARCGCEYEWGVHLLLFGDRVGFEAAQVASLTFGTADDPCWKGDRDPLLVRVVDSLHDTADVPDHLWSELSSTFTEAQILDLLVLSGWYHAICYIGRAARTPLEAGAPTFASAAPYRP